MGCAGSKPARIEPERSYDAAPVGLEQSTVVKPAHNRVVVEDSARNETPESRPQTSEGRPESDRPSSAPDNSKPDRTTKRLERGATRKLVLANQGAQLNLRVKEGSGISYERVMANKEGLAAMLDFAELEFSGENLRFYKEVRRYQELGKQHEAIKLPQAKAASLRRRSVSAVSASMRLSSNAPTADP